MKQFWNTLCRDWQLGLPLKEPERVFGGYMHKMYRLDTPSGSYAVKLLNPEVMARPQALGNYRCALAMEKTLEEHALPIVPALSLHGQKLQKAGERYYLLFPWVEGSALPWEQITKEHCMRIGALLAKQHALVCCTDAAQLPADPSGQQPQVSPPEGFTFDWSAAVCKAEVHCPQIAAPLREALPLLLSAQERYNAAIAALPQRICICNGDMDSKNVLWQNGQPLVIDLECLCWGNPVMDLVQLALDWAGVPVARLNRECLSAFLTAYRQTAGTPELCWDVLSGIGFAWLDWLHYSVQRAAGGQDEEEIRLGTKQTLDTLEKIRFYASVQKEAAACFAGVFAPRG